LSAIGTRFPTFEAENQVAVLATARFIAWVCFLELLWGVFVGTTQSTELIAGLMVSVVVAAFVTVLRRLGVLEFRFMPNAVARAWSIPGKVVFDFFLVGWVLVKAIAGRRRVRGQWLRVPFEDAGGPQGRFLRAVAATLENDVPNGLVVDLNDGEALLHSFDTRVSTGRSVL
jgi:hypothetical protein